MREYEGGSMKKKPVFIFDADGVLLDSLPLACEAFNQIAEANFPSIPRVTSQADMALVYPGPLSSSLRRFGLTKEEIKRFFEQHTSAMRNLADQVDPFDSIIDAIQKYARGYSAIVSSAHNETICASLRKSRFYDPAAFTQIRGRESGKDKAQKIKEVLLAHNASNDDAIYIGDTVSDILYCKSVPIKVAAVGYGYHPTDYLAAFDPDFLLPDTDSLVSFLQSYQSISLPTNLYGV
jgi:phosphoglycolate phosphatase-like HAD superfamily hydrolase